MAGENKGSPQIMTKLGPGQASIGVMGVDNVRNHAQPPEILKNTVGEFIKIRPENFFAQISFGTKGDTDDIGFFPNFFNGFPIAGIQLGIKHAPGDEINPDYLGTLAQSPGKLNHVFDLPSCVRVAAKLHVKAANQPVNAQMDKVKSLFVFFIRHPYPPTFVLPARIRCFPLEWPP